MYNFTGSSPTIEMEHLSKLVYLEYCAKEAMRLFPPVPYFARRIDDHDTDFGWCILTFLWSQPKTDCDLVGVNCQQELKQLDQEF